MVVVARYLWLYSDRFRLDRAGSIQRRERAWGEDKSDKHRRLQTEQSSICTNQQTLSNVSPAAQSLNPHPLCLFLCRGVRYTLTLRKGGSGEVSIQPFLPHFSLLQSLICGLSVHFSIIPWISSTLCLSLFSISLSACFLVSSPLMAALMWRTIQAS